MPKKIDMIGRKFGRLSVIESGGKQGQKLMWLCQCDCGAIKRFDGSALRTGNTASCGCLRSDVAADKAFRHGGTGSHTYTVWESIKKRCFDSNQKSYKHYGAKGVSVCERWMSFANFLADMGERPEGAWIDRIDNSKGYEPVNCRWATPLEQQLNRTNNKHIEFNGETKTQSQWAREQGIADSTLSSRLKRGWSIERALTRRTA